MGNSPGVVPPKQTSPSPSSHQRPIDLQLGVGPCDPLSHPRWDVDQAQACVRSHSYCEVHDAMPYFPRLFCDVPLRVADNVCSVADTYVLFRAEHSWSPQHVDQLCISGVTVAHCREKLLKGQFLVNRSRE